MILIQRPLATWPKIADFSYPPGLDGDFLGGWITGRRRGILYRMRLSVHLIAGGRFYPAGTTIPEGTAVPGGAMG